MRKLFSLALLLFTLNVDGAANKLVSTLPTTNVIWMTNYVMVVLQAGLSNQTFLVPWTNIAQQISAGQVWTNAVGDVKLNTYTTHDTLFIGSNAPLAHPPPFNAQRLAVLVHDQAIGETADAHIHLESYDNLVEYGNGNDLVSASFDLQANSSSNSPFVGLQIFFTDYHGNGEYFDFLAEGDVYSQFLFTSLIGSPKDNTPMVMAPNFTGTSLTPLTAYKFGTRNTVTNGDLVQVLNAGTNLFSVDYLGGVKIVGTTNQVTFGATNDPPVSAIAPTRWISVQITGESGVYRLPLYE